MFCSFYLLCFFFLSLSTPLWLDWFLNDRRNVNHRWMIWFRKVYWFSLCLKITRARCVLGHQSEDGADQSTNRLIFLFKLINVAPLLRLPVIAPRLSKKLRNRRTYFMVGLNLARRKFPSAVGWFYFYYDLSCFFYHQVIELNSFRSTTILR